MNTAKSHLTKLTVLLTASTLFLAACAHQAPATVSAAPTVTKTAEAIPQNDLTNAVLWQQTAVEYRVSTMQAFRVAAAAIPALLVDKSLTAAVEQTGDFANLPPAIVVDVDETMLDNSPFEARIVKQQLAFSEAAWTEWCNEQAAKGVPGAKRFTKLADQQGVRIMYLSNRDVSLTEATRANLDALGFADATNTETFFFRDKANGFDSKGSRRAEIAKRYRIIMLVGDNFGDFHEGYKADPKARRRLSEQFGTYWGSRWIMIANAMYGSWEQSLYGFDSSKPIAQQRAEKLEQLNLIGRKKKAK
jgi:5'-nucleotidase (lipoprotein e(P4) family)